MLKISFMRKCMWRPSKNRDSIHKYFPSLDSEPGMPSAIREVAMIYAWAKIHMVAETFKIRNPIDQEGKWLPQDILTIVRQCMGLMKGLRNVESTQRSENTKIGDQYANVRATERFVLPTAANIGIRKPESPSASRKTNAPHSLFYGNWFGGGPPPGGGSITQPIQPSTVGGVYLGGAGKTIDGFGSLSGVAIDRNNNLLLLGPEGDTIDLPPLRLDDAVTVFRSVYLYGEGPTVTIDPASENPTESAMVIRHGKGTEDTYVGWILYEADRLMKGLFPWRGQQDRSRGYQPCGWIPGCVTKDLFRQ